MEKQSISSWQKWLTRGVYVSVCIPLVLNMLDTLTEAPLPMEDMKVWT